MPKKEIFPFNPEYTPRPVHPGRTLISELKARGLVQLHFHQMIGTSPYSVREILRERVGISPDMAYRLGKYFGTGTDYWMTLQKNYDLAMIELKYRDKEPHVQATPQRKGRR